MHENDDPLFDVVHSLPVLSYSIALAQRTPTAGVDQRTKYMPDYGGYLETTTSCLKNNALASGIPFNTRPENTHIKLNPDCSQETARNDLAPNATNCLALSSYLDSCDTSSDLSVMCLQGQNLNLHLLHNLRNGCHEANQYGQISMKDKNLTGFKHIKSRSSDHLLVKSKKRVKLYELNRSFKPTEDNEEDQVSHKLITTVNDRSPYVVKDASLSSLNKNIVGIAADNHNVHSIKLYDLSVEPRQSFHIEWATLGNEFPSVESCLLSKQLRGRVVRTFSPMQPTNHGTQQLDHIPSHLCNLLVTNEHRVSLVDPRSSCLSLDYLSKSELPSFFPIEYLKTTVFSHKNDYQLYSLTNVHLRVIDTRYPGVPVAQIGHMLDADSYNSMDIQCIEHIDSCLETICCSSSGRLCFITFDQTRFGSLVNPKSTHMPYHDTSLNENSYEDMPAFGLSAISAQDTLSSGELFSVFQLDSQGHLLLRSYKQADGLDIEQSLAKFNLIPEEDSTQTSKGSAKTVPIRQKHEMPDRDVYEDPVSPRSPNLIDLIDSSVSSEIENRLESKRALEKYELMKNKLCKF